MTIAGNYSGYCPFGSTEVFWIPAYSPLGMGFARTRFGTGFFVLHNYGNCYIAAE
jgi:hypothetical protein